MVINIIAGAILLFATVANANTYHFAQTNPNNNTLVKTPIGDQLTLDVNLANSSRVLFSFTNPVGIESSIIGIYFGDEGSTLFSSISITNQSAGVSFKEGATPPNFPVNVAFTEVETSEANGNKIANKVENGVNASGESITFEGLLKQGNSFSTVLASILSGDLKFGLLLKTDNGSADKYLNTVPAPSAVPVPAALWLFGSVIGLFGVARRRFSA